MAQVIRGQDTSNYDTTFILSKAIPTLEAKFVLSEFCEPAIAPEHAGSTARWTTDTLLDPADLDGTDSAFNALDAPAGTPITFATRDTFNEDTFAGTNVEAQILTYGAFIPLRKKDLRQMVRGIAERVGQRLGTMGRDVLDTLIRARADGSGTGFNPSMGAGSTTTRDSIGDGINDTTLSANDQLTAEDIVLSVNDLRRNDAQPFSNGYMAVVIHSGAEAHVLTDVSSSRVTWFDAVKHVGGASGQEKILSGAIGGVGGGMVYVSNNITTSTVDTQTAYNNLVIADWGLGCLSMGDMNPRVFVNDAPSVSDPHRFYKTVAFQLDAAPQLLDSSRVNVLYSTQ